MELRFAFLACGDLVGVIRLVRFDGVRSVKRWGSKNLALLGMLVLEWKSARISSPALYLESASCLSVMLRCILLPRHRVEGRHFHCMRLLLSCCRGHIMSNVEKTNLLCSTI